jgi:hypothetical protein
MHAGNKECHTLPSLWWWSVVERATLFQDIVAILRYLPSEILLFVMVESHFVCFCGT